MFTVVEIRYRQFGAAVHLHSVFLERERALAERSDIIKKRLQLYPSATEKVDSDGNWHEVLVHCEFMSCYRVVDTNGLVATIPERSFSQVTEKINGL